MSLLHATRVLEAAEFAAQAHGRIGHLRKFTGEPYFTHLAEVAASVAAVPGATEEMVMGAYLHDTVEDTPTTLEEIRRRFGEVVAGHVDDLTDKFLAGGGAGNRRARKLREAQRLSCVSSGSQTIKVADLISNTGSIVQHDPAFARVYLLEKEALLALLTQADPGLRARAGVILAKSKAALGMN